MDRIEKIEQALNDIRNGKMIIVVDDEDRENEGDFVIAAEKATPEDLNFMMKHGRGLICISITESRGKKLELAPMVGSNTSLHETNFTVSVDARKNISTGISAKDRWQTAKIISNSDSKPSDLVRPGHLFPLISKEGGVLRRAGHTEAGVDMSKMAGLDPSALIVEIVDEDGNMARMNRLTEIGKEHSLKLVSIADLIYYRRMKEALVEEILDIPFPLRFGEFSLKLFEDKINGDHHMAIIKGEIKKDEEALVRVHSQCLTGDLFGSLRCDCGPQLVESLKKIESSGKGVLVYLRQEGRGIGLKNKLKSYQLQDDGLDTVEANEKLGFAPDLREYGIGAQILKSCGVRKMRLLTNNPRKIVGLEGYHLEVVGRESIEIPANKKNSKYLKTKRDKLGHFILGEEEIIE